MMYIYIYIYIYDVLSVELWFTLSLKCVFLGAIV